MVASGKFFLEAKSWIRRQVRAYERKRAGQEPIRAKLAGGTPFVGSIPVAMRM
jgi:hypothetical protein